MADIDQIIAGGAGAGTTADFSGIPKMLDYFYKSKDEAAKNDLRDAFKGGLPMKDGQVDWPAVTQKFFEVGAVDQGISAAGQSLAQQKMEYGQKLGERAFPSGVGSDGPPPAQQSGIAPINAPSPSRSVQGKVAPELNKGGVQEPQLQSGQETPKTYLAKQGLKPGYNMEVALSYFKRNGIDPDQPFNPNDPRLAKSQNVMQRLGSVGQVQPPQPGDGQPMPQGPQSQPQAPPQVAQAPMQPPQGAPVQPAQPDFNQRFSAARPGQGSDPTLGGLVPAGRTAQQQISGLSKAISTGMLSPEQAKVYQSHIDAITKAIEPTGPMKEYDKAVQQGFKGTIEDWQNRTDDNTMQRDILTKSTLPLIEKSRDKATSAIEDIDAIHRSREELDQPGGVITGIWANDKLKLAKIGNSIGIPNSDKITNTEAFSAAVGKRVAAMVKAFGSGTAISDGDRRFAEKMAGGGIELNETSMRRILDIGEQADRAIIGRHNEFTDKAVKSNEGLKPSRDTLIVPQPGQYKKPESGAASFPKFNSASDVQAAIASKKLKSGDAFLTSDGRTKYVP